MDGAARATSDSVPTIKCVLLGDQSVGKTSLHQRIVKNTFSPEYRATVGIDFVVVPLVVDGKTFKIQLWDTAGQEKFMSVIPMYLRNSAAAILVYDISDPNTFQHAITRWVEEVKVHRPEAIIALVGNKLDLSDTKRRVTTEEAQQAANKIGAKMFLELSAKTGQNANALFPALTKLIAERPIVRTHSAASVRPKPAEDVDEQTQETKCLNCSLA